VHAHNAATKKQKEHSQRLKIVAARCAEKRELCNHERSDLKNVKKLQTIGVKKARKQGPKREGRRKFEGF